LGDAYDGTREDAATALGQLEDPRAMGPLTKYLHSIMPRHRGRHLRTVVARALVNIVTKTRNVPRDTWRATAVIVTKPHRDVSHENRSGSDCYHDDRHTDIGIGLDFPKPPGSETDVKPDF